MRVVVVVMLFSFLAGCPERKEAIDQVGGAPKAQVDNAKERLGKAEDKLQQNAAAADAAKE